MFKIITTSKNALKVSCIKNILENTDMKNICLEPTQVPQDVKIVEQPMNEGTVMCCVERINSIYKDEDNIYISLENGIFILNHLIYDVCVLIVRINGKDKIYYSFGIPIDKNLWDVYTKTVNLQEPLGYDSTFGNFLAKNFGVEHNNWSKDPRFGDIDRRCQIMNVLEKWLIDYETEIIPDFPKPGVQFANIESVTINPTLHSILFNLLETFIKYNYDLEQIDYFAGLDARGFYFAPTLARVFGKGFLPIRKIKKVPRTKSQEIVNEGYTTEYSDDMFGLRLRPEYKNKNVIILDDLLATGGTLCGATNLCRKAGLNVLGCLCVYDIEGLRHIAFKKLSEYGVDKLTSSLINVNGVPNSFVHLKYIIPKITLDRLKFNLESKDNFLDIPKYTIKEWRYGPPEIYQNTMIISSSKDMKLARKISQVLNVPICATDSGLFNNSETRVEIQDNVRNSHIIYICSTRTGSVNNDIMELLMFTDACTRSGVSKKTVVLPYFPYARSDKKDKPRVPIGAALIAKLLKTQRIDNLISLDLHSSQLQGLIDKGFHNLYIIKYMCEFIHYNYLRFYQKKEWNNNFVLVSPDAGSIKRIEAYGKKLGINYIILHKQRDYSKPGTVMQSTIVGPEEMFKNKVGIIIDDMGDTFGTVCAASKILVDAGMKEVIVCVTHGVLSGPAIDRINSTPYIKEVVVTDSLFQENNLKLCPKLKVLSAYQLISRAIDGILTGQSISQLFD